MSSHIRQSRLPIGAGEQFKSQIAPAQPRAGAGPARTRRTPGARPVIGSAVARPAPVVERLTAPASLDAQLPRTPQAIATLPSARATRLPRWIGAAALLAALLAAGLWTRGALVLAF